MHGIYAETRRQVSRTKGTTESLQLKAKQGRDTDIGGVNLVVTECFPT